MERLFLSSDEANAEDHPKHLVHIYGFVPCVYIFIKHMTEGVVPVLSKRALLGERARVNLDPRQEGSYTSTNAHPRHLGRSTIIRVRITVHVDSNGVGPWTQDSLAKLRGKKTILN